MDAPTTLEITFSGAGVEPRKFWGRSLVAEDNVVALDGTVLARWTGKCYEDSEGGQYDRYAVSWVEKWEDIELVPSEPVA